MHSPRTEQLLAQNLAARPSPAKAAGDGAAAESPSAAGCGAANDLADRVAAALERARPLVRTAAANYPEHRKCFSCHHQTLPMLAVRSAGGTRGEADVALLKTQAEFIQKSFEGQIEDLRKGTGIGGRALTVGYGLWSLSLAGWKADETTAAMVTYLVKTQYDDGHWDVHTSRPPMEDSWETSTAVAIAGVRSFATAEQKEAADAAIAKAVDWLVARVPKTQEDKVFRLRALHWSSASQDALVAARQSVLAAQRDDGGWAQMDGMESDAYAAGQTLFVLHTSGMPPTEPAFLRGIEFLLKTQAADGSWFVKSRSKPIQVYFDNGDPHGKDQFISTPATCWALAALELVNVKATAEKTGD
jgi:N-acyl-D-amino-acid deacylase